MILFPLHPRISDIWALVEVCTLWLLSIVLNSISWFSYLLVITIIVGLCVSGAEHHMNCDKPFDGHGGELAHSWAGGDVHFDEDENYKRDDPTGTGINLLKVGLHLS